MSKTEVRQSSQALLPADVTHMITKREWDNSVNLKSRLLGNRLFPIRIGLKPPAGRAVIDDLSHFQKFVSQWNTYPNQQWIEWETRHYRSLSEQRIPKALVLNNIQDLIDFVGEKAKIKGQLWKNNMTPLLTLPGDGIYPVLVQHLARVESMTVNECQLLKNLISQLSANMGVDRYLRALPLVGVDTKFLENHQPLVSSLLDVIHDGALSQAGGLLNWLDCLDNPKGWICVRPLCEMTKQNMAGFPILQLSNNVLRQHSLPATNILVVENIQSGLGLPNLPDTIAVFGGGKNVAWMNAEWLKNKRVAYWGDIDSWGLSILSDVRAKLPEVTALMMDHETLEMFKDRMVIEPESVDKIPPDLNKLEQQLFIELTSANSGLSRLEQERLSSDYIQLKLEAWISDPRKT
jgi:hypothetical protein